MDIDAFYEKDAARRMSRTLGLLAGHNVSRWDCNRTASLSDGRATLVRPLHDLDSIAASFDCLPVSLGDLLVSRHVHPHDPPAKTMLQAVDRHVGEDRRVPCL